MEPRSSDFPYACLLCPVGRCSRFRDVEDLHQHLKGPHQFQLGPLFPSKDILRTWTVAHVEKQRLKMEVKCWLCPKVVGSGKGLAFHVKDVHGQKEEVQTCPGSGGHSHSPSGGWGRSSGDGGHSHSSSGGLSLKCLFCPRPGRSSNPGPGYRRGRVYSIKQLEKHLISQHNLKYQLHPPNDVLRSWAVRANDNMDDISIAVPVCWMCPFPCRAFRCPRTLLDHLKTDHTTYGQDLSPEEEERRCRVWCYRV